MHASIGRYSGVCGAADDLILATRHLAAAVSDAPGFVSCALLDMGDGALAAISVFESRPELDLGNQIIGAWITEHLPMLQRIPEPTEIGEIIFQHGM